MNRENISDKRTVAGREKFALNSQTVVFGLWKTRGKREMKSETKNQTKCVTLLICSAEKPFRELSHSLTPSAAN